jgi:NADH-quinone oxidoreductase subunit N
MSTIIKAGVLIAAVRLFGQATVSGPLVDLLALLPLISIVWGNLAAMRQSSFRRMIAYSSIAHAGFLYYAFLGAPDGRYEAVLFYVLAYALMNLLAFAALPIGDDDAAQDRLATLKGLFQRDPYSALMIGLAMLSLAGIPPLPGFVAKFLIFKNVIAAGYTTYAVLGLVGSYLGIYFYLRVIQYMFMGVQESMASAHASRSLALSASVLCLVPSVLLIVFPGWVIGHIGS